MHNACCQDGTLDGSFCCLRGFYVQQLLDTTKQILQWRMYIRMPIYLLLPCIYRKEPIDENGRDDDCERFLCVMWFAALIPVYVVRYEIM